MTKTQLLLSAAFAGVMAAATAQAEDAAPAAAAGAAAAPTTVKCYGITKAGQNACASASGSHACKGMAAVDNDPNEWSDASAEDCEKNGGKLTSPQPPAEVHHE